MLVTVVAGSAVSAPAANAWSHLETVDDYCSSQPKGPVTAYYSVGVGSPDYLSVGFGTAIAAWNKWASVTGVTFKPWNNQTFGPNDIWVHAKASPVASSAPRTLAVMDPGCDKVTGRLTAALITTYPRLSGQSARKISVTLAHEIGHALGLGHNKQSPCTTLMNPSVERFDSCGSPGAVPSVDDVAGVMARYQPGVTKVFAPSSAITAATGLALMSPDVSWPSSDLPPSFSPSDGSDYYRWTFVPIPGEEANGWGYVVNTATGACLVAPEDDTSSWVRADRCAGKAAWWFYSVRPDGTHLKLMSAPTKKCLAASGTSSHAQTVTVAACTKVGTRFTVGQATDSGRHRELRSSPDIGENLIGQGSGKCLAVSSASRASGASVLLASCLSNAEQLFAYHLDSRALTVYDPVAGSVPNDDSVPDPTLCLTAAASSANGSAVTVSTCAPDGGDPRYQQWQFDQDGNVRNVGSRLCLTVQNASTAAGARVFQYDCNTGSNEVWSMPSAIDQTAFTLTTFAGDSGRGINTSDPQAQLSGYSFWNAVWDYTVIANTSGGGLLKDTRTGLCLRSSGGPSGTQTFRAALTDCNPDDPADRWVAALQSNGSITLRDQKSGMCLDVFGEHDTPGAGIGSYPCGTSKPNQQWRVVPTPAATHTPIDGSVRGVNVAPVADLTASSSFDSRYVPENAVDGVTGQTGTGEWASKGELTPWIRLEWGNTFTVDTITLADRPNLTDRVLNATITFSDGSTLTTGTLPDDGTKKTITFPARQTTWIKIQVTQGAGGNVGLAEIEASRTATG